MAELQCSVIIPAFNTGEVIGEQLAALEAQREAPVFEVVVADNGSTDDTADVIRAYNGPLDVRVVDASQKSGASHARNLGAEVARADVLIFCDSDDLVDEYWVRNLFRAVSGFPEALAAGALHHERFNDSAVLDAYGIAKDPQIVTSDGVPAVREDVDGFAGYLPTAPGGNMALHADLYRRVGGMDNRFPGGSEETDFAWRVIEVGGRVVAVDDAVVHYRLRRGARAIFRQQRIQQRARIFLWTLYGKKGMTGPSLKHSLKETVRAAVMLAAGCLSRRRRLRACRVLGGNVGALEGMVKYRWRPRRLQWRP